MTPPTRVVDGETWIAELRRLRERDAALGHWAHELLRLARRLHGTGDLRITVAAPLRWRGERLVPGDEYEGLGAPHREWLIAQANLITQLARSGTDPVGVCAAKFIDWIVWFWTADGCHPRSGAVRRDAIKHDPRHLNSTAAARRAIKAAAKAGIRPSSVVEHEHAVPKRVLIRLMLDDGWGARDVLIHFAHAVVVTKDEHRRLNLHYRNDMPEEWEPSARTADAFARYSAPEVGIAIDPPNRWRPR